jgi:xylulokinase
MANNGTKYILSIDMGTSGPKSALVSTRGEVLDFEFEETGINLLPEGGAEQNPDDWWNAIIKSSRRVLAKKLVPVDDIVAVCCSTQWSGTVAVDRDGNPLMNAIIWLDSRGSKYTREITDGLINIEGYELSKMIRWIRLTGGIPTHSGKDPVAHILLIKNEFPEIYKQTYKFLEPKDYINLRFTGKFAASFDSITLHWVTDNRDISNIEYDSKLLKITTLDREKLPDLRRAVDILGPIRKEIADELGLNRQVQVVMGTPDMQAAAIGSGAVRDYEGHLYIGTSSFLVCHLPFKKTDIFHSIAALPSAIPGKYFTACEQDMAGGCLNYLRDNILYHEDELLREEGQPDIYKIFDRIAEGVPAGSGKLIFTPWLYGEKVPVENHSLRGGLFNLSLDTNREHMIRAVFEGVAYNSKWMLGYVEKFIKRRMDPINMVGGGASSNVWCQIHADVLDRTIRQVRDPIQTNARGTALLASVALGYLTFDDVAENIQIANTYKPNPDNRAIYDEIFAEFLNIYKNNKKMYERLNAR